MIQLAGGKTCGVVGDEGDSKNFHARLARCNCFKGGGHSHEVAAERASHLYFGRGLVVRTRELGVHAFRKIGVDLTRNTAKTLGVEVRQIHKVRAFNGRGGSEVKVVGNEYGGAGAPLGNGRTAAIGENAQASTGSGCRAYSVRNCAHALALVMVGARTENECVVTGLEAN